MLQNRVLTEIFGPKTDEVAGEWRKLHNEELYGLYSFKDITQVIILRRQRWAVHVARVGVRGAYRILMGRLEGKRPLGRPGHRCEENIKMNLQGVGWAGMNWIDCLRIWRGGGLL